MNNAITQPATGETTPATKRKRTTAATVPVTPGDIVRTLTIALQAATDSEAAANAAAPDNGMETEADQPPSNNETNEQEPTSQPEPVPLRCSLLSLPPAFNSFADTISKKVSSLMMAKRAKLRAITKLQTREIIPTPIRFQFELSGSKEVTGNDDFFGLSAACSMAIQTCQADLKSSMAQVAQMEVDVLDSRSRATFHQALNGFAQLVLIEKASGAVKPTTTDIRDLALNTLDRNVEHFTKAHNFNFDPNTLFTDYKKANECAHPVWILGNSHLNVDFSAEHTADCDMLTSLMYETFVQRWNDKRMAMDAKEKARLLEATQKAFFQEASTKEAAAALALEKSMDETIMNAVISGKIAAEHKLLHAKINKLESSIRRTTITDNNQAKNSRRGANIQKRASKEKTNAKAKETPSNSLTKHGKAKAQKPGKADAHGNASSNANTNSRNGKQAKKKPGNSARQRKPKKS
jgi:hypothetical protein